VKRGRSTVPAQPSGKPGFTLQKTDLKSIILMKKTIPIAFACLLICMSCFSQNAPKPVSIIFDSDMGPDYDDVGAIAILHAFADSGYVKILATVASTKYKDVAAVFDVLNTYFGRPDIPIGVPGKKAVDSRDFQHWSDSLIANYPHSIVRNEDVPDAVDIYRKTLAAQPDHSVTIVTVGFFTNLADLLQSGPDRYSGLNGVELVKKKVSTLVSMAGRFPSGKEFNVHKDAEAARHVFMHWPTPVLLSGFEIGEKIKVGLALSRNAAISNSPVKDVFRISIPQAKGDSAGRMSWDETAVLVAAKGYEPYYNIKKGKMVVAEDGSNTWSNDGSDHAYLIEKVSPKEMQAYIEKLISHQPVKKTGPLPK
jgi:inosine-uridine nucleoside N-ribohydrolase